MSLEFEFVLILVSLAFVAFLYSTVGHGGASGYLAVLSLTAYGLHDPAWLKQHVWCLNLIVASLAFWHYKQANHHDWKLTFPFIIASIPSAFLGGFLRIDGEFYDILLSITLVWAAWRLSLVRKESDVLDVYSSPDLKTSILAGGLIGLASGVIGVGGGIFLSPIILLNKWATPKTTAATSALFIWVNSAAGLAGASLSGQLSLESSIILPFAGAVLIGGFFGSRYGADAASQQVIRKLLVLVLIIAATRRVFEMVGMLA